MEKYTEGGIQVDCPECGKTLLCGFLVVRTNSRTGHRFLGCSNYPVCNFTDEYDDPDDMMKFENHNDFDDDDIPF